MRQQDAFACLKKALVSAPILKLPKFDLPFVIHVDASDTAIGAVLTQSYYGKDMPVCCFSKCLNDTEKRWSIYEREMYAIISALGKWRCYIINKPTVVYTDHQPLKYFLS